MEMTTAASPPIGHCNTMGTALSMNALAEAIRYSLPVAPVFPAPYRDEAKLAYATGSEYVNLFL